MKLGSKNRVLLASSAGVSFVLLFALGLWLLFESKFTGAEFIAFVTAFAVLAVAVGVAPEIQEISIAGSVVKLKEVKAEAIRAIDSLNKSRVEMLRVFLALSLKHSGGFGSTDPVDPRTYDFWKLLKLIRDYQCFDDLKCELLECAKVLAVAQLGNMRNDHINPQEATSASLPSPFELACSSLASGRREEGSENPPEISTDSLARKEKAFEEYSKFYELIIELEAVA